MFAGSATDWGRQLDGPGKGCAYEEENLSKAFL
jgi:hypothetical protein